MEKKRLVLIVKTSMVLALLLIFAAVGCSSDNGATNGTEDGGLSGELTISGSTTVLPLAQEAADQFMEENPGARVTVQGGGSSVGISNVSEGVVDIGNASRALKEDEEGLGLIDHEIALDVITVIVNPDVAVTDLTAEQVNGIFTGAITNWSEVGGADASITVVIRDEASGTREVFDEKALDEDAELVDGAIESNSNGIVRQTVASTPDSIGYVSLGYLDSSVSAVSYDGIEASAETAVDGTYPLARYLHMFTKGQPAGLAEAYIEFVLSDKFQSEIVAEDYIPVTEI
jgi:phosphate transport system substrate-binding protein